LPSTLSNDLLGITAAGTSLFAVGAGGVVARRVDGTWQAAFAPGAPTLRAAWAASEREVWAVGDFGTIVRADGAGLTVIASPTGERLRGVWGAAPDDVWAVGEVGTLVHFDGAGWRAVTDVDTGGVAGPPAGHLLAVWGSGPRDVWAVGYAGYQSVVYHFDGARWRGERDARDEAADRVGPLYAVGGSGPGDAWAAGRENCAYRLTYAPDQSPIVRLEPFRLEAGPIFPSDFSALVSRGPADLWALTTDGGPWHWDGARWSGQAVLAGPAGAVTPEALWTADAIGHMYRHDEQGSRRELGPGLLAHAFIASDVNGIAVGDLDHVSRARSLWRWNGVRWSPLAAPPDGDFTLAGTRDGHSALVVLTYRADRWLLDVTLYGEGEGEVTALPTLGATYPSPFNVVTVGGTSPRDVWAAVRSDLWHFDGASWERALLPLALGLELSGGVSAYAPDDVWVSGTKLVGGRARPFAAHFDGNAWTQRSPPGPPDFKGRGRPWLAASGPDEAYAGIVARSDEVPPGHAPDEGAVTAPELYRWAGGAWQKVDLPGCEPTFRGAAGVTVAARDARVYVGLHNPHPGASRLLVRENGAWAALDVPLYGVDWVFPTATSLWVEKQGPYASVGTFDIASYGWNFPPTLASPVERLNVGASLLRLR
jgi:hypothetical protein